jgi:serine/threonine protein kinase
MANVTTASLTDDLRRHRLLDYKQLDELGGIQSRFPEPQDYAKELIRRGWLTEYQARRLLQGRAEKLVLGSYIILDPLGEGSMGQVFKARHRDLRRVAAVKLIRKDKLHNPNVVKRFEREVRAAAALDHPNIVLAYDADKIGGKHMLVMEYIEGAVDLGRVVAKHGPLPVEQACDCVRQAALGLQHASERGLVHRDIKPHNLLVTADGKTVKIVDMGLARLDELEGDESGTVLTRAGTGLGTADYVAPEQALSSHTADIRADIYSLGCTFYYLLTAQVPFPDGGTVEKLVKHMKEKPRAVERIRPDIPPEVAAVVRKMMAKKPLDRYQTPAEVAAVLAKILGKDAETSGKPGESGS